MRRREFLMLSAAVPVAAVAGFANSEAPLLPDWRTFELATSVEVASPLGRTQLWLPAPVGASSDYQRLLSTYYDAPGALRAQLVMVPGYDVQLLNVEWADPAAVGRVTLAHRVATCDRRVDLGAAGRPSSAIAAGESAGDLQKYLRATALLPTDGIVRATPNAFARVRGRDRQGTCDLRMGGREHHPRARTIASGRRS